MASQTRNGKAFEFAVASELSKKLNVQVIINSAHVVAKGHLQSLPAAEQESMRDAARKAAQHIVTQEPNIKPRNIYLSNDSAGETGDVRDVVIVCEDGKEIGISCKNNHSDTKHSRLSKTIDFVAKWGINTDGATGTYWSEVNPIFDSLALLRKNSNGQALWRDMANKADDVYHPLLNAWEKELLNQCNLMRGRQTENLFRYLVGTQDAYKVMKTKDSVTVQTFNVEGTLNSPQLILPSKISRVLDSEISAFGKKVEFTPGWDFNFRLHNASSRVEPSLKFAVSLTNYPASQLNEIVL